MKTKLCVLCMNLICVLIGVLIGFKMFQKKESEFSLKQSNQTLRINRHGAEWIIFTYGSNMECVRVNHEGELVAIINCARNHKGVQQALITTESKQRKRKVHEILNPDQEKSLD